MLIMYILINKHKKPLIVWNTFCWIFLLKFCAYFSWRTAISINISVNHFFRKKPKCFIILQFVQTWKTVILIIIILIIINIITCIIFTVMKINKKKHLKILVFFSSFLRKNTSLLLFSFFFISLFVVFPFFFKIF